jgi:hypothetical protein
MTVKVSDSYAGIYGCYNILTHSVEPKKAGDSPFEVPDSADTKRLVDDGILVPVAPVQTPVKPREQVKEPEIKTEAKKKDYSEMSYDELKTACKERDINFVGKSKKALIELLSENEAPELTAEDPV